MTMVRDSNLRPSDITPPPKRSGRGIEAELELGVDRPAPPAPPPPTNVVAISRPRRWTLAAVAAVAVLLGIGGTIAATDVLDDGDDPAPVEEVVLEPLPTGPQDVSGQAALADEDGVTELRIETSGLAVPNDAFFEVWVIDPDDLTSMYSLGALGPRADGRFTVPPNVDLRR
jgi:anti-sigma-K factor RskA